MMTIKRVLLIAIVAVACIPDTTRADETPMPTDNETPAPTDDQPPTPTPAPAPGPTTPAPTVPLPTTRPPAPTTRPPQPTAFPTPFPTPPGTLKPTPEPTDPATPAPTIPDTLEPPTMPPGPGPGPGPGPLPTSQTPVSSSVDDSAMEPAPTPIPRVPSRPVPDVTTTSPTPPVETLPIPIPRVPTPAPNFLRPKTTAPPPTQTTNPQAWSTDENTKSYVRGDRVIVVTDTTQKVRQVVMPDEAQYDIVGGKPFMIAASTLASTLAYGVYIPALLSVILLGILHFGLWYRPASLSSWLALTPSRMELAIYVTYIQSMASLAHYVVIKVPSSLWQFVDTFSWTVFLPFHGSASGIGDESTVSTRRRLNVVVLDGLIAFADRIGVQEDHLLSRCILGLVIITALASMASYAFVVWWKHRDATALLKTPTTDDAEPPSRPSLRRPRTKTISTSVAMGSVIVIMWTAALYPLSTMASYELMMQVRASDMRTGSLIVAILALVVVCIGGLALCITGISMLSENLYIKSTPNVWASLCSGVKYSRRLWFVSFVAVQVVSGVIVATVTWSDRVQLALLLGVQGVYLLGAWWTRPFADDCGVLPWLFYVVGGVKMVNLVLAFAFITDATFVDKYDLVRVDMAQLTVGTVFITLNSTVIVLWFGRHAAMMYRFVRTSQGKEVSDNGTQSLSGPYSPSTEDDPSSSSIEYARLASEQPQEQRVVRFHTPKTGLG